MHAPYPPLSTECFGDIIRMVRGRTVRDELPLFAKCVYTLVGSGLAVTIGEPADVEPLFGAADVSVDDLEQCKAALQELEGEEAKFGVGENEKLDPATIAMFIQLAITLISKWLERRKT